MAQAEEGHSQMVLARVEEAVVVEPFFSHQIHASHLAPHRKERISLLGAAIRKGEPEYIQVGEVVVLFGSLPQLLVGGYGEK